MASTFQQAQMLGTHKTPAGVVTLRSLTAPDQVKALTWGRGLGAYCRYRAGETQAILRRVLKAPEGRVVAAIAGETGVAHLSLFRPDPEERWGQRAIPGLLELGTFEVDRAWRGQGLARALLQAAFGAGELDTVIVVSPQYATDWDLEATGLSPREYRHLILRLFRRHGFAEFLTDDPLVAADPRNFLPVRVGEGAPPDLSRAFRSLLTVAPPRVNAAQADRHQQYLGTSFATIRHINQLPAEEREAIYRRLIPPG